MAELHIRTVTRAVTYRVIALLITALWTGLADAVLIHIVLTAVHYIHERAWLKIRWGRLE
jgi:uncharacterized membrane protein